MSKKLTIILLVFAFILSSTCLFAFSRNKKTYAEDNVLNTDSKSCYLSDYNSNTVIYSKNENERLPIASMCKIMTLNIIFDEIEKGNINLDEKIFVSENASKMGGSQIFLEGNCEYNVKDLIKGIVVASANDACVAFAERICGSEEAFVERMNEKARELKMSDTLFSNCTGLPKIGQYSTAKDVSKMFSELLKHKDYFKFSNIWTDKIQHKNNRVTEISNTNKLIRFYEGCDGGKTGYTSEAGHCLSATAVKGNMRLISVVISAPDSKTRFNDTKKMFNYAFDNYENRKIFDKNENLTEVLPVERGKKESCSVSPVESYYIFCKKGEKQNLQIDLKLHDVEAPVVCGQEVGVIEIYKDSKRIAEIKIQANENVEKMRFKDFFKSLIKNWTITV